MDRQPLFTLIALHRANSLSEVIRNLFPPSKKFKLSQTFSSYYAVANGEDSNLIASQMPENRDIAQEF